MKVLADALHRGDEVVIADHGQEGKAVYTTDEVQYEGSVFQLLIWKEVLQQVHKSGN